MPPRFGDGMGPREEAKSGVSDAGRRTISPAAIAPTIKSVRRTRLSLIECHLPKVSTRSWPRSHKVRRGRVLLYRPTAGTHLKVARDTGPIVPYVSRIPVLQLLVVCIHVGSVAETECFAQG